MKLEKVQAVGFKLFPEAVHFPVAFHSPVQPVRNDIPLVAASVTSYPEEFSSASSIHGLLILFHKKGNKGFCQRISISTIQGQV